MTRPDRMVSVHDPESRHVHKTTSNYRDGFKAHVGVEPDSGLITACELTAGNVGDAQAAPGLLVGETTPVEVLADSAYGSGGFRQQLAGQGHTATIKPIPLTRQIPGGFTIDDFAIDTTAGTVDLPKRSHRDDQPRPAQLCSAPEAASTTNHEVLNRTLARTYVARPDPEHECCCGPRRYRMPTFGRRRERTSDIETHEHVVVYSRLSLGTVASAKCPAPPRSRPPCCPIRRWFGHRLDQQQHVVMVIDTRPPR